MLSEGATNGLMGLYRLLSGLEFCLYACKLRGIFHQHTDRRQGAFVSVVWLKIRGMSDIPHNAGDNSPPYIPTTLADFIPARLTQSQLVGEAV